jgi:hypothetical protein
MRVLVCLMLVVALLTAVEQPPYPQLLADAARTMIRLQRPDGGWDLPRDRMIRVTVMPPPPAVGDPAPVLPGPEDRYRSSAPAYAFAAEALYRVADRVPEARIAADRALRLASLALLADPKRPPALKEAGSILCADLACGSRTDDPTVRRAAAACRVVFDEALRLGSTGGVLLGLPDHGRVDLLATCWAGELLPSARHVWIPAKLTDPPLRVSRYQPLLPEARTDRQPPFVPVEDFEDGSAFAAQLAHPSDEVMTWLAALYGRSELSDLGLERALVCLRVFAKRPADGPDVWWREAVQRWTAALLASAKRVDDDGQPALLWEADSVSADIGNAYAIHWLLTCQGIIDNDSRRTAREEADRLSKAWSADHITGQLALLAQMQQSDGSWPIEPEASPLACLAFLGAGYDHITPNQHRKTLRAAIGHLASRPPRAGSIAERALCASALCEAYAMTSDSKLKPLCKERITSLLADRQQHGGWSVPGEPSPDWRATALAILAWRSAFGGDIATPIADMPAWWLSAIGEIAQDQPRTLVWKATVGAFIGKESRPQVGILAARLAGHLEHWSPDAFEHWATTLCLFHAGGEVWRAWRTRCMQLPVVTGTPATIAQRLLADEVIQRSLQVEASR